MKFSTSSSLSIALAVAAGYSSSTTASADSGNGLPPHHPPVRATAQTTQAAALHPTLAKFSQQFRCPYAQEWLAKGAHKAAIDLGLTTPEKVDAALKLQKQQQKQQQQQHTDGNNNHNHNSNRQRQRQRKRRALEQQGAMGSCSFTSPWSGPSCTDFRGGGWDDTVIAERCAAEPSGSIVGLDACPTPPELAGYCVKDVSTATGSGSEAFSMYEASAMMISGASDCAGNMMACETFVGGTWEASAACGGSNTAYDDDAYMDDDDDADPGMGGGMMGGGGFDFADMGSPSDSTSSSMGDGTCLLAPGAIGAAHQAGFSNGYSAACPGSPAEGSPYMWPMAWSTDTDTQSMAFGSDDVMWRSKGRTFYRLDKNWKRSDTTYSKGILRTIGQGPCDDVNAEESANGVIGCNTNSDFEAGDPLTTMIHRGSKMYFITWKNSTEVKVGETDPSLIDECSHMDLMVIGNIRPDWFLDDRGDDTDVQYLGDQHVYYADGNVPRLVKQWRKKDFASQYFTMSVTGNPSSSRKKTLVVKNATTTGEDEDNNTPSSKIHWPLILNIPGEGFGDDMLQVYKNHELLTDDDDDLFLLIENLEASGGSCPLITGGGGGGEPGEPQATTVGPPQLEVHVPSNLEVDPNSWFSNLYTFSPVWQPPIKTNNLPPAATETTGVAVTEEGRVRVESCYDASSRSVQLSVEWLDVVPVATETGARLPWVSLGYRRSEICEMNPIDGSDSKIVMVTQGPNENAPKAYAGSLGAGAQRLDQTAISSIYGSFWPLDESEGYSGVSLSVPSSETFKVERSSSSSVIEGNPTSVKLSFREEFNTKPETMHLMYAIGMSPQLGIHISRGCFEVAEFPACSGSTGGPLVSAAAEKVSEESKSSSPPTVSTTALIGVAAVVSALSLVY